MEAEEIQQALLEFIPLARRAREGSLPARAVHEYMLLFLQKVLDYDLEEDIVFKELVALPQRPREANFDQKIKFVMTTLPAGIPLDAEQEELAIEYALAAPTNVVMLSNGIQVHFYSVDVWEGKWEIDSLVEINLLEDEAAEIAQALWPLAKKDCHRKVWVNIGA